MKVKLRVPLSNGPRQVASPLFNARVPEDTEIGMPATPQLAEQSDPESEVDEEGSDGDDDDEEGEDEGDELDELDELEDEAPPPSAGTSTQASPKRSRITLKSRAAKGQDEATSPSPAPTLSAGELGQAGGLRKTRVKRQKALTGKRAAAARQQEAASLTVEELDALPAAKRRKSHKARGAPGPGRGWRKGLTKGQKPVYEIPANSLPEVGSTPDTFGNTAATGSPSHRASNLVAKASNVDASYGSGRKSTVAGPTTVRIQDAKGGTRTVISDPSAKVGTARNPGFRYPALPSSRGGPPILPIPRIPVAFPSSSQLDKASVAKHARSWEKGKREFLSLGGRLWSVPTWYGGQDKGFEKKIDPSIAPLLAQAQAASALNAANVGGAAPASASAAEFKSTSTPTPAPSATTPTAAGGPATPSGPQRAATGGGARLSPEKAAEGSETPSGNGTAAGAKRATGTASPLPPPRHVAAVTEDISWRGQSPAFLAGGR